jgi:uncharacterized BrkB/YihY/UPF0761 family membrane protein
MYSTLSFVVVTGNTLGMLTLFVPQAQPVATQIAAIAHEHTWQLLQVRLLGCFTALNVLSFILIFFFVPETAGATVSKEEDKLNYMSLEGVS